jgi:hypothetical protein
MTLNRPTRIALNFVDYLGFENRMASRRDDLNLVATNFIADLENLGAPVCYAGTGPRLADNLFREAGSIHAVHSAHPRGEESHIGVER